MTKLTRLADLAASTLAIASEGSVGMEIEVRHIRDVPGFFAQMVTDEPNDSYGPIGEALACGSYGIGIDVGTRRSRRPELLMPGPRHVSEMRLVEGKTGIRTFRGVASPNPAFLYESQELLEGIVAIDGGRSGPPTLEQGSLVRRILHRIAEVAFRDLGAPILSIHSPCQVPTRSHSEDHSTLGEDDWSHSSCLAVRFAIATGPISAEDRARGVGRLVVLCKNLGVGLAISDSRPERRAGSWFDIWKPPAAARVEAGGHGSDPLFGGYPMTFVGPTRVGTTSTLLELLNEVDDLPVLSSTVIALDDLAFVSVTIGVTRERYDRLISNENDRTRLRDSPQGGATAVLPSVLDMLGFRHQFSTSNLGELQHMLGDYSCSHGPLIRVNTTYCASRPIWIALDVNESGSALGNAMRSLNESYAVVVEPVVQSHGPRLANGLVVAVPNVEYLVTRRVGDGRLRLKGKLGIPEAIIQELMPGRPMVQRASVFAKALEGSWSRAIAKDGVDARQLSVAWRESWLGHWVRGSGI